MRCNKCGFILGARPNSIDKGNTCQACINKEKNIDWEFKKKQLKDICKKQKEKGKDYDCVIAVSGGKDSTVIVKTLVEEYNMNPLLVTVTDEFTHTKAGLHNLKNIAERWNLDHIIWRCKPKDFIRNTKKDFIESLHPLKWIEKKIYQVPIDISKKFGIGLVFFGEDSAFQYGTSEYLSCQHELSTINNQVLFFFAYYPYTEVGNRKIAKENGFIDLEDTGEWLRQGHIENYTQQDSIAYVIQLWTKFVKFGFQRVSDMACRYVRDGKISREQAISYIKERDWQCDPMAKKDFCRTIGITEKYFDEIVDKHANKKIVKKDINGQWKLIC